MAPDGSPSKPATRPGVSRTAPDPDAAQRGQFRTPTRGQSCAPIDRPDTPARGQRQQFSRKHASAILAKLRDTPEAANTLMKRLRLLLNFAVDIGMIPSNPMAGMKGDKSDGEVHHDWTEEGIAPFMACHQPGTRRIWP